MFRRPQVDALDADTELVTLTAGGNDVGYIGDLSKLSRRSDVGLRRVAQWALSQGSPRPVERRPYCALSAVLREILVETSRRAPRAHIVVVTYPAVLPPVGACPQLGIAEPDVSLMRAVSARLADVTRECATSAGATVVDMAVLSMGHDACSAVPWVNGRSWAEGAPFHPTVAGAEATARAIAEAIGRE